MKMIMPNGKLYRKYTIDFVKNRALLEGQNEYEILSDSYKTRKDKLLWKHKICGKTFLMDADGFFNRKNRCPHCYGGHKFSNDEFLTKIKNIVGNEYDVLEDYKGTHTPIKFLHKKCGNIFEMRPNNFIIKGNRCPYCINKNTDLPPTHSSGEENIQKWLIEHHFNFQRECKFKETGNLRFDFKVFLNDKSFLLIEYDGRFHFPLKAFKSQKAQLKYEQQIKNDNIKNEFCKNNNIHLIRISNQNYKNIEKILNEKFNDYLNSNNLQ